MTQILHSLGLSAVVQVLVLAMSYYYVFMFFRGTRGAQILAGLVLTVLAMTVLTKFFSLDVLGWILRRFTVFLGVALLVIFQPEIRRALAEIGRQPRAALTGERRTVIDNIVQAIGLLAEQRIGALVAIEREIGTRAIRETGVALDAPVIPELLASIFYPHTPMHDGGVVILGSRIAAAGCVFPLSQDLTLHKQVGTRHRAAVGLSEETDAVIVVVSEETGIISVAYRGRLSRGLDPDRLRRFLGALMRGSGREGVWKRVQSRMDLSPRGLAETISNEDEPRQHDPHT